MGGEKPTTNQSWWRRARIPRFSKDLNLWKVSHPPPPSAPWTLAMVFVGRFAVDFVGRIWTKMRVSSKSPKWWKVQTNPRSLFAKTIGDWWNKSFCYRCFHDLRIRKHQIAEAYVSFNGFMWWHKIMMMAFLSLFCPLSRQPPCESWRQKLTLTSVLTQFTIFCSRLITMAMCGF